MSNELRYYAVFWFDARSMPDGQQVRSVAVRTADMKDALTLFEHEGELLSGYTWHKGGTYRIRAITKDEYAGRYGEGGGPIVISPGHEPGTGRGAES